MKAFPSQFRIRECRLRCNRNITYTLMKYILIILFICILVVVFFVLRSFQLPAKIKKAEELIDEGEYNGASNIVRAILEKNRDYVPARYIRAQILMRQKQYLMAISELNAILGLPEFNRFINELEVHYYLAQMYNETKSFQKEIDEYRKILSFNPDDLQANYRIGHALFHQKDYKRAKEHLLKVVLLDPKKTDCFLPLGISCYHISDYEKAEQYLLKSMDMPGEHYDVKFYLGSIYKMKKDHDNAVAMLNQARADRKYFTTSLHLIGEIYFEKEQYEKAIEYLEQGLKNLKEKTDEAYAYRYLLAECYEHTNKIKEAVHHWEKIAADNPNYRSTKMKLDSYRNVMTDSNLMELFGASMEELQPMLTEMISGLHYNIVAKEKISSNEYQFKAYNIKRINDPPLVINFLRTTREVTEEQINDFQKRIIKEKCKNGIFIATSRFSLRAKAGAASKLIDLYDSDFVSKTIERINAR